LRNHGNSPHSEDFDLNVLTDDIKELYHKLKIDNAVIIGHSLGGRIAISAVLKYPDLFSKIIVVDIAPRRYTGNRSISGLLHIMNRIDLDTKKNVAEIDEAMKPLISDIRTRQLVLKNVVKNNEGVYEWKSNLKVITKKIEELMTPVFEEVHYSRQALFIKGGKSDFVTLDDYKIIYRYFPNADIEIIQNAGHWVHADEPQLFLEKVMCFLED
jgi:esterase